MKFIIDGDGTITKTAALDLLTDIIKPYDNSMFITRLKYDNPVTGVLNFFDDMNFRAHNSTPDLMLELQAPGDKIFIVLDSATRPDLVNYCLDNNIQVLDLIRGLYPVRL